jgi:uncharacterized membrane protein YfcA
MGTGQIAVIALGALAGGFVSGLAGFGTGITAISIWLFAVSPPVAASLVVVCSVIAQIQTLPAIWHAIEARRVLPFIVPGIVGVPLGTALLAHLDTRILKLAIGALLLLFSGYMLLRRSRAKSSWGGAIADGTIGFGGGVLGGLAGLSGPLPTMWATIRGWGRHESRGVFQAFNLTILSIALLSHAFAGLLTAEVGWALLAALPGTLGGAWLGAHAYGRLDDHRFRVIILVLLCISGSVLIWRSAWGR